MPGGRPPKRNIIKNVQGQTTDEPMDVHMEASDIQLDQPGPSTSTLRNFDEPRPVRAAKTKSRESISNLLAQLNAEERLDRLEQVQQRSDTRRSEESADQRANRLDQERQRFATRISNETAEERASRTEQMRQRMQRQRAAAPTTYKAAASADIDYLRLGSFNVACMHCQAVYFPEERVQNRTGRDSFNDCCLHGKLRYTPTGFPNELALLFTNNHRLSNEFISRLRRLDAIFAFASFNVADDRTSNARGIYCFTAGGQIYHRFNFAAQPTQDAQGTHERPRNGQMFFLDPEDAVSERVASNTDVNRDLLRLLDDILRDQNPFAQAFMMMREVIDEVNRSAIAEGIPPPQVKLMLAPPAGLDLNRYNIATSNEVSAVITLNADQSYPNIDRVVRERGKQLVTLYHTDNRIEPFTYPLFYPRGEFGYTINTAPANPFANRLKISRKEFVSNRLAFRPAFARPILPAQAVDEWDKRQLDFNALHFGGRLLQQYVVDMFISVERDRIEAIKAEQKKLKAQLYTGVDTMLRQLAEEKGAEVGKKIILPSSFIGSTRWYTEHFEDSMAIVRRFGRPDFFITVTTNPEWPEIVEALRIDLGNGEFLQQKAQDRPDIVARVAKLKFVQF